MVFCPYIVCAATTLGLSCPQRKKWKGSGIMPHRNPVTGRNSGVKWSDSGTTNIYGVEWSGVIVVRRLREHRRSAPARNVSTPSKGNWQQRCGFRKKKVMMITAMVKGNVVERKDPTKPAREEMGTSCAWGIKEHSSSVQFSRTWIVEVQQIMENYG